MLIAHADWSLHPGKRWLAVAHRTGSGWDAAAPVPVGELSDLVARLRGQAGGAPVPLGIDTPIGLPVAYAERAGIASFRDFLAHEVGHDEWADFATPAGHRSEIGLRRPFYPFRPGGTRLGHLVEGLGVSDASRLRRACELASTKQPGILFWTLGASQTGKAALRAWIGLIRPALTHDPTVCLWPFDGELPDLIRPGRAVIAETYPAAAARTLDVPILRKTSQVARRAAGVDIRRVCDELGVEPSVRLSGGIEDGFGPRKDGEDPFDALLGLLGMVAVVAGARPAGIGTADEPAHVRTVEGWILGVVARPTVTRADTEPGSP